jgi:hypothetical protein
LRHFLDDSIAAPTAFGVGYLCRFLARSFHGFHQADPDDFGYFSYPRPKYMIRYVAMGTVPPGSYRTLIYERENHREIIRQGPGKNRKWLLSPYPGFQLEYLHRWYLEEYKGDVGDEKGKRLFLRLVGWAFWNGNDLNDWINFGKSFAAFRDEARERENRGLYRRKRVRYLDAEYSDSEDSS